MGELFRDGRAHVIWCGPEGHGPVWDLTAADGGIQVLEGWANTYGPPGQNLFSKGARQEGATWLGSVVDPSKFEMPVHISKTATVGFRSLSESFLEGIDFDVQSRIYVLTRESGWWWLDVRLDDTPEIVYPKDGGLLGFQAYNLPLIAEYPWWSGLERTVTWVNGEKPVKLRNPGNRPAFYTAVVKGPGSLRIPDGDGRLVTLPKLKPGQVLRLDTDPDHRTLVVENPAENLFKDMDPRRFRVPVARNSVFDLSGMQFIDGTAESSVVVRIDPKNRGPW
ncbi:hypothetical protein [Prescottella equi]|uniref:hypothetical protein n=1 Tax=Rhodococcus hoagii TaxID=43767 RepID=UPI00111C2E0B|nr:hypothetical protein [Prescottella equi]